jgi:uncharacterized membrane protein (DUF485 family)
MAKKKDTKGLKEVAKKEKVVSEDKVEEVKPAEEVLASSTDDKDVQEVSKDTPVEEESDFADEEKQPEPIKEEVKPEAKEEAKPDEGINMYKEGAEEPVAPVKEDKKHPVSYEYTDESLEGVEVARKDFYKIYKKSNVIKWIVTSVGLALIVVGYIVPLSITAWKDFSIYITLGVLVFSVLCMGIYSWLSKKKLDKAMSDYFTKYYDLANSYVFNQTGVSGLQGSVNDKIKPEDFMKCGLYKDVYKVGSRDNLSFVYHDGNCRLVDCAAQTKGQKTLLTVFVGKYLSIPNNHVGNDVVVYLKGNKRALPPTKLDGLSVLEDHNDYVVYGVKSNKNPLSVKTRKAINDLHTDATLVDLAIAIRTGTTYFLMGYEDNLMVLPLEKAFNPAPTTKFKEDFKKCLAVADSIDEHAN